MQMYKNMTLADDLEFIYSTNSPSILINEMTSSGQIMNKLDLIKRIFRTQVKRHLTQFISYFFIYNYFSNGNFWQLPGYLILQSKKFLLKKIERF